jgi:hypothetical protein
MYFLYKIFKFIKSSLLNILGIYNNFEFKNANKFYSIEIGYLIDSNTNLHDLDKQLDNYMNSCNNNIVWIASDCGPLGYNKFSGLYYNHNRNGKMIRCNNYYIYDLNFDINKFKLNLPFIFYVQYMDLSYKNNHDIRYKRIKR